MKNNKLPNSQNERKMKNKKIKKNIIINNH